MDATVHKWINQARQDTYKYLAPYQPTPKWQSAGGVVVRGLNRDDIRVVYMIKPSGNFNGGWYTFPKGKIDPDETPEVAAVREIEEETGLRVKHAADSLLGWGEGTMSKTAYYLMILSHDTGYGPDWETEEVRPVRIEDAIKYLRENKRERDLRIAELALDRINEISNYLE